MTKDMEAYGYIEGPEWYWVGKDHNKDHEMVLPYSGFQSLEEVMGSFYPNQPDTEDVTLEIRKGFSYQMCVHSDAKFFYTADQAQDAMDEEVLQAEVDYEDGAYDRWADDQASRGS